MIDLKTAILEEFATSDRDLHKGNLIGRNPSHRGPLENRLGITFNSAQRSQAGLAFDELKRDGLIGSTYRDLVDPENWLQITELGKSALKQRTTLPNILNSREGLDSGSSKFGIPNHVSFENDLKSLAGTTKPISVLFLDLDNFKFVNDNHDHTVGDYVIKEVIELGRGIVENKGRLYHRSGDEMIVLLENFDPAEATTVGERIRKTIAEYEFSTIGKGVITATIGAATFPADDCATLDELERLADRAAMQAKKCGKNRVIHYSVVSSPPPPPTEAQSQLAGPPIIRYAVSGEPIEGQDIDRDRLKDWWSRM